MSSHTKNYYYFMSSRACVIELHTSCSMNSSWHLWAWTPIIPANHTGRASYSVNNSLHLWARTLIMDPYTESLHFSMIQWAQSIQVCILTVYQHTSNNYRPIKSLLMSNYIPCPLRGYHLKHAYSLLVSRNAMSDMQNSCVSLLCQREHTKQYWE